MERLTIKSEYSEMVWFVDKENNNHRLEPCEMEPRHSGAAIRKLAKYEELDEQDLLIKLPCKVGDTCWVIDDDCEIAGKKKKVYEVNKGNTCTAKTRRRISTSWRSKLSSL